MITIIIPTLNRPNELSRVIKSIISQTKIPSEIVIVDQSFSNESKNRISLIFNKVTNIKLNYIHNNNIQGLVEAKKVGVENATEKIILFLDDDVVLELNYVENIFKGFNDNPGMVGCSGVITNPPKTSFIYIFFYKLFHRGVFFDLCINLDESLKSKSNYHEIEKLVPCKMLSGGVSAWRSFVFKDVPFDVANKFHTYEDFDFSLRVYEKYGKKIFINPNARLKHYSSDIERLFFDKRQRGKVVDCFTFYKKRSNNSITKIIFIWLLMGMFLEAFYESVKTLSLKSLRGYFSGIIFGFKKKIII